MLSSYTILDVQDYSVKTVVIDAGHGGKDPGCHGPTKIEEADVALAIAKKLGNKIKTQLPGVKVVYTRDTDKFIELHERANIANKNGADLFISIHCNAASPAAYGTETYTMGLHKTNSQLSVMERENQVVKMESNYKENYKNFEHTDEYYITRQIMQNANIRSSNNIAAKVEKEFKNISRHSRGVNQAGFLVLWKTTMPSILVESGFLTNKNEESFLKTSAGQDKIASAIFKAVKGYKAEQDKLNK